ncbi:MAG: class I SAM-dependent methyltransferase [Euryarchaeota archaeon]|nr:class I SAM-dependent methyltransferase [Euryarchaeota archaeon]
MIRNAVRKVVIPDHTGMFPILWNVLRPHNGERILDIGMGNKATSASAMAAQGLAVVGMDINPERGKFSKTLDIPVVACDAAALPFKDKVFEYCAAVFSLHEMDPTSHDAIFHEMERVAETIVIMEPLLRKDGLGGELDSLWFEAMKSAEKFEIYQPMEYWEALLRDLDFKEIDSILIDIEGDITEKSSTAMCAMMGDHFQKEGVSAKYLADLRKLAERLKKEGMPHSEVLLPIGRDDG